MRDKMIRSPEGHSFDPARHGSCRRRVLRADLRPEYQKTRPALVNLPWVPGSPQPPPGSGINPQPPPRPGHAGKAVRVGAETKVGFDPILGWPVCAAGPDRGRDFRQHTWGERAGA